MINEQPRSVLADQYRISGGLGRELPAFAESLGIDIVPIAEALDIDPADFRDLDSAVSLNRFCRLFEVLATISGDPAFGLKYSEVYVHGGVGAFEYGLMHAPTLRHSMEFFVKFAGLRIDLAYLGFEADRRHARLEWSYSPLLVQREQYADFAMAANVRNLNYFLGPGRQVLEAQMERREPRSTTLYRALISPTMTFNAPINAAIISTDELGAANRNADERLFDLASRQCEAKMRERRHQPDIILRIKEEILGLMDRGPVPLGLIARRLATSERSLQRRLAEDDTTYQHLLDETRRELSDRLLRETDLPLSEISYRLGFSAPSAYSRAAIRWYGKKPSAVREAGLREGGLPPKIQAPKDT